MTSPSSQGKGGARANPSSLELIFMRLRTRVIADTFRRYGLSLGGGGLLIAGVTVATWVPAQLDAIVRADGVRRSMAESVAGHLESDAWRTELRDRMERAFKANPALRGEMERTVATALRDDPRVVQQAAAALVEPLTEREIAGYFSSAEGRALVRNLLGAQVTSYFESDWGRSLLDQELRRALASGPAATLVREYVREQVERATRGVAARVEDLADVLVRNVDTQSVEHPRAILKGSDEVRPRPAGSTEPAALVLEVLRGDYFRESAIRHYIERLRTEYGEDFDSVLVREQEDDRFLLLVELESFERLLGERTADVMELLARSPEDFESLADAREAFVSLFGVASGASLRIDATIEDALRSDVWDDPGRLDEPKAVLDDDGRFLGTTTRALLLEALLDFEPAATGD